MSKRSGSAFQPPRKKRKGGVSYSSVDVDSIAERPFREDIRVWKVTKSETTGRVSATRRTHRHIHADPLETFPEGQPPTAVCEDIDGPADLELDGGPSTKLAAKRRKGKATKENDSVSPLLNCAQT